MKKAITILSVAVLILLSVFIFAGCKSEPAEPTAAPDTTAAQEDPTATEPNATEAPETTEPAQPADDSAAIVGSWKNDELGYDFIYTFNADGSGSYNAAGTEMAFTYTISGNKLSILYTDSTVPFETTFSIDADTLNVVDSLGSDTLYQRIG